MDTPTRPSGDFHVGTLQRHNLSLIFLLKLMTRKRKGRESAKMPSGYAVGPFIASWLQAPNVINIGMDFDAINLEAGFGR